MAEYIEREAVLKKMQNWNTKGRLVDCVENAPAADVVEVRRGEWVKKYPQYKNDGIFYCSKCRGDLDIATGNETPIDRGFYFCFNCGADMRGESDGRLRSSKD